jgi:FixJ family two-component response regulator
MSKLTPVVYIVDDDPSMCRSLSRLVCSAGMEPRPFGAAGEFLRSQSQPAHEAACVVLDLHLPGIGGLEIQRELAKSPVPCPVIFVSGDNQLPAAVEAMRHGAVTFLAKPFDDAELLGAIDEALEKHRSLLATQAHRHMVNICIEHLTGREREVMAWVITGALNKQIAAELEITEATVKVHRGRVMEKMNAASLADLVRLCASVAFPQASQGPSS